MACSDRFRASSVIPDEVLALNTIQVPAINKANPKQYPVYLLPGNHRIYNTRKNTLYFPSEISKMDPKPFSGIRTKIILTDR
jgi:hypothetical protein